MNKKALVLVLCSMLCIPVLTGCESSTETDFSLFNIEVKSDKSEEALENYDLWKPYRETFEDCLNNIAKEMQVDFRFER